MPVLSMYKIVKEFPQRRILRGVEGVLPAGIHVMLGPNGAGKSTLLGVLSTQSVPSDGHFELDGLDSRRDLEALRAKIGTVGHRSFLYPSMTLRENLSFYAELHRVERASEVIEALARRFAMESAMDGVVRSFSRGMQQRAAFMRALLHDPPCLLLDEPFTGLDPRGVEIVMRLLAQWREERRLVLLTTHDLHLAARCATHLLLLVRGRLQAAISGPFSLAMLEDLYHQHFPLIGDEAPA